MAKEKRRALPSAVLSHNRALVKPQAIVKIEAAVDALEAELGGRDQIIHVLSQGVHSPELQHLLGVLHDPLYEGQSLHQICLQSGITTGDLLHMWERSLLTKAQALAKKEVAEQLPAVTRDLVKSALPQAIPCDLCVGSGSVPDPETPNTFKPCKACKGKGHTLLRPDLETQKLVLDLGEMLPKKGGGLLIQQNNMNGAPASSAFGQLERIQHAVAQAISEPIDIEALSSE